MLEGFRDDTSEWRDCRAPRSAWIEKRVRGRQCPRRGFDGSRDLAELEVESTAYIVCADLGLDTSAYSLGNVATWAGGGDEAIKGIRVSANQIQFAAKAILDALVAQTAS